MAANIVLLAVGVFSKRGTFRRIHVQPVRLNRPPLAGV